MCIRDRYQGSGYEHAAEDLFRILNDVSAEKVQEDCQTELTEELQKTANDIHYGNAQSVPASVACKICRKITLATQPNSDT